MKNWFNLSDRTALLARLDKLSADRPALWGRMTAHQVVCHLADPIRVALGDRTAQRVRTVFGWPGIGLLTVWLFPWPKGAPTAPEFLAGRGMTSPSEFEKDKQTLLELLQRFSDFSEGKELGASPVFGVLNRRSWGRLMWRHVNHHLGQFGV